MPVPMLDLRAQHATIAGEIQGEVAEVFAAQQFRGGPRVDAFEEAVADYSRVSHAVGVGSGSDALYLLLRAIGIQPGDEVITTPFTFFATGGAIVNAGGIPVFADIERDTFNIDAARIEACITPKTKALLPVHIFGQCAGMRAILDIAGFHGLKVIEDAAQALGTAQDDAPAGSTGDGAALSFYPTKNLGAAGEGGMVLTRDDAIAARVRRLRCHGSDTTYIHEEVGVNSHLDAIQAAVLDVKLRHLDAWNDARRRHAAYYTERFGEMPEVVPPVEADGNRHIYHQYVIRLPRRDGARKFLQDRGIGCGVFYPVPLHKQACFAHLPCAAASCPEAERACEEVLALPIYPELTHGQLDEVVDAVGDFLSS